VTKFSIGRQRVNYVATTGKCSVLMLATDARERMFVSIRDFVFRGLRRLFQAGVNDEAAGSS